LKKPTRTARTVPFFSKNRLRPRGKSLFVRKTDSERKGSRFLSKKPTRSAREVAFFPKNRLGAQGKLLFFRKTDSERKGSRFFSEKPTLSAREVAFIKVQTAFTGVETIQETSKNMNAQRTSI
jgi:hypothetical protein